MEEKGGGDEENKEVERKRNGKEEVEREEAWKEWDKWLIGTVEIGK